MSTVLAYNTSVLSHVVRERRTHLHLSQKALANRASLSKSFIEHIERGRCNPTLDSLLKLARALDCNISDMVKSLDFFA